MNISKQLTKMSKNTRSKANSLSASNVSENNDLNELDGGLEAVMQTKLEIFYHFSGGAYFEKFWE